MPPQFRSVATDSGNNTITIPKPAGLVVGDVMLNIIAGLGASLIAPTGWALIEAVSGNDQHVYGKVAAAGDVAATGFTWSGLAGTGNGSIAAYSGAAGWGVHTSKFDGPSASHTVPSITIADIGSRAVVLAGSYNFIDTTPQAGWTERVDYRSTYCHFISDKAFGAGPTGTSVLAVAGSQSMGIAVLELLPIKPETAMQAVTTFSAEAQTYRGTTADAQVVTTFDASPNVDYAAEATFGTTTRVILDATGAHALDFTNFDAYIETQDAFFGVLFDDSEKPTDTSRRLQPVRQDVGNNPAEIRPEFGDVFAQNDFSHGSGQTYFHQLGRDPKRFFTSEGYDISEPGRLEHLHLLSPCFEDPQTGPMTQAGGLPFVGVGSVVRRGNGTMPGTWTDEDPSAGEPDTEVLSLATEGDRLFAALGPAGVHVRNAVGLWSHLQPDGATDLNVTPATGVFWVKDRLMVIGGTDSRQIFEVIADSTPTAIDTLKEGWMFVDVGEAGGFIEACAVNLDAGQSIIYSYGLTDAADAIERKSSTPMPIGQLAWTVNGTIGTAFIGGGKANAQGGYDPFLYRATVNQLGELDYVLVRQERGASAADLSVRAITPIGDSVLLSWTLGSEASFGDARDGIAIYNLGRDSLARHLRREGAGGANKVLSILPYKGQTLVSIESFGLYFENLNAWVPSASVITSLADWNNAGDKVWDQIEVAHDPLPLGSSVNVEYSTLPQVAEEWNTAIVSQTAESEGALARLGNTLSRIFALRITSTMSGAGRPVVQSFSVRSHPHPARPEWDLVRVIRLVDQDQKDDQSESLLQDPRVPMAALRRAINTWITFYESGVTWTAFLTDVAKYEPAQPLYDTTGGEARKDVFVVQLQMTGTEG